MAREPLGAELFREAVAIAVDEAKCEAGRASSSAARWANRPTRRSGNRSRGPSIGNYTLPHQDERRLSLLSRQRRFL
jgi:hypothetical protein